MGKNSVSSAMGRMQAISGWRRLLAIGALLCFCGGVVFTQRSVFHFDPAARRVVWRRTGLFTRKGGEIPFEQIRCALVQTLDSGGDGPSYRAALMTDAGEVPLTDAYCGNITPSEQARDAINAVLAVLAPPDASPDDIPPARM